MKLRWAWEHMDNSKTSNFKRSEWMSDQISGQMSDRMYYKASSKVCNNFEDLP